MAKGLKEKLLIERMSFSDFNSFRKKHLDNLELDKEDLNAIKEAFNLNLYGSRMIQDDFALSVNCDEAHAHKYSCIEFKDRSAGVVYRLLSEIKNYQEKLDKINEVSKYPKE